MRNTIIKNLIIIKKLIKTNDLSNTSNTPISPNNRKNEYNNSFKSKNKTSKTSNTTNDKWRRNTNKKEFICKKI